MPAFSTPDFLDAFLPAEAGGIPETSAEGVWDDQLAGLSARGDTPSFRLLVTRHEAALHGFSLDEVVEMPANNLSVVFRRG